MPAPRNNDHTPILADRFGCWLTGLVALKWRQPLPKTTLPQSWLTGLVVSPPTNDHAPILADGPGCLTPIVAESFDCCNMAPALTPMNDFTPILAADRFGCFNMFTPILADRFGCFKMEPAQHKTTTTLPQSWLTGLVDPKWRQHFPSTTLHQSWVWLLQHGASTSHPG